jgi:LPS sulfotransferase NodH
MSGIFVILTHVRSGSSMLADMLAQNDIGAPDEHLNVRFLRREKAWDPAEVLAAARSREAGSFFGSKVMIHWLDDLKQRAGITTATDPQLLSHLFGERFMTIHLYREDSVATAVSLTIAELTHQWHLKASDKAREYKLPSWEMLRSLISDNLAWIDWCKHRLRMTAPMLMPEVVEMRYEDLTRDPVGELKYAAEAIMGEAATGRQLVAKTGLRKQRDARSEELRDRWLSEYPEYIGYNH